MDKPTINHSERPHTGRRFGDTIPRKIRVICIITLLAIIAVFQLTSIREENQTIDEGVHLAAGVSYWLTGDFRLNEEHPPLVKLISALPVVLAQPTIHWDSPSWQEGNQWAFARDLLYEWGNDADTLLLLGRLPMIALTLTLGVVLYLWGRRLAGDWAGLFTLAWFAFDPNFLAHGRYITTDVPVTLGYAATLYLFVRLLDRWTWQRMLAFAAIFGLTQVTKFSALFLYAIIILAPILWYCKTQTAKTIAKRVLTVLGLALAGTIVAVTMVYGGQLKKGSEDPWVQALYQERQSVVREQRVATQPGTVQKIISLTNPDTRIGKTIENVVLHTPIPSWSYFKGIVLVLNHDYWGHLAYVNGTFSNFGWWWYFPFALLIKTPFATLILLCVAICAVIKSSNVRKFFYSPSMLLLTGVGVLYLLWSMTSNLNLGVRHVYPVYVGMFVTIGVLLANVWLSPRRWLKVVIGGISILYVTTSFLAYPAYTAYFSEIVGGTANGPKYLVDSNIDWGQDAKRLLAYTKQHNIPYVCMSYFGQASLRYYQLDHRYLPTQQDPHTPEDIQCVVAISVTSLLSQDGAYAWLRNYVPDEKIGGSIYVYDFRNGRTPPLAPGQRN